jgi:hypothetical protein
MLVSEQLLLEEIQARCFAPQCDVVSEAMAQSEEGEALTVLAGLYRSNEFLSPRRRGCRHSLRSFSQSLPSAWHCLQRSRSSYLHWRRPGRMVCSVCTTVVRTRVYRCFPGIYLMLFLGSIQSLREHRKPLAPAARTHNSVLFGAAIFLFCLITTVRLRLRRMTN